MDLSNELLIAIAFFIRKPADVLQLCLANRRCHNLILPLLYGNIVLHHLDYPTGRHYSLSSNVDSLCRLLDRQQNRWRSGSRNGPDFGARCRSLNINMYHTRRCQVHSVIELFNYLPFLRNLRLIIGRRQISYWPDDEFPFGELSRALHRLGDTLENLTLYIAHPWEVSFKDGIGNLYGFKAMKQLRIQSGLLVGRGVDWPSEENQGPSLSRLLPPKLEDLTIHCCVYCGLEDTSVVADHFETRLDNENSARSFASSQRFRGTDRRVIESVVVCMQDPKTPRSKLAAASTRLASCFDIVGRNMVSADEN